VPTTTFARNRTQKYKSRLSTTPPRLPTTRNAENDRTTLYLSLFSLSHKATNALASLHPSATRPSLHLSSKDAITESRRKATKQSHAASKPKSEKNKTRLSHGHSRDDSRQTGRQKRFDFLCKQTANRCREERKTPQKNMEIERKYMTKKRGQQRGSVQMVIIVLSTLRKTLAESRREPSARLLCSSMASGTYVLQQL
jgi:hypothetical protein